MTDNSKNKEIIWYAVEPKDKEAMLNKKPSDSGRYEYNPKEFKISELGRYNKKEESATLYDRFQDLGYNFAIGPETIDWALDKIDSNKILQRYAKIFSKPGWKNCHYGKEELCKEFYSLDPCYMRSMNDSTGVSSGIIFHFGLLNDDRKSSYFYQSVKNSVRLAEFYGADKPKVRKYIVPDGKRYVDLSLKERIELYYSDKWKDVTPKVLEEINRREAQKAQNKEENTK